MHTVGSIDNAVARDQLENCRGRVFGKIDQIIGRYTIPLEVQLIWSTLPESGGFLVRLPTAEKWQKCAGISGLWVLNEIIEKKYPENMKKIVGAVWKLPAK